MGLEELPARHPTIREAVTFVEWCGPMPALQAAVRKGASPEDMIRWFSEAIDESLAEDDPPENEKTVLLKAKEQFRVPEFAVYLTGRLGLM
jgi:hypothetical protein